VQSRRRSPMTFPVVAVFVPAAACLLTLAAPRAYAAPSFLLPTSVSAMPGTGNFAIGRFGAGPRSQIVSIQGGSLSLLALAPDGSMTTTAKLRASGVTQPVLVGDVDGDGKADIVCGIAGGLAYWRGHGDGTFDPEVDSQGLPAMYSGQMIDLNGDGRADIVGSTRSAEFAGALLATADGHFVRTWQDSVDANSYGLLVGRFDADTIPDLLMRNGVSTYQLYHGRGDGTFTPGVPVDSLPFQFYMFAADLDGDGKTDLMRFRSLGGTDGRVAEVMLNPGDVRNGTWASTGLTQLDDNDYDLMAGDVDGDGAVDLVSVAQPPNGNTCWALAVAYNDGHGGFQTVRDWYVPASYTEGIGDFDGDGHPDLLVGNATGAATLVRGLGGRAMQAQQEVLGPIGFRSVTPARLRPGAGRDLVVASGSDTTYVLRRDPDGTYEIPVPLRAAPPAFAWLDQNGDGLDDYLGATADGTGLCWWWSDGAGGFTAGPPTGPLSVYWEGLGGDVALASLTDVDGDGQPDLVEVLGTLVTVRFGHADGTFSARQDAGIHRMAPYDSLGWVDLLLADLDRDGRPDVVLAGQRGSDPVYMLETWLNDGHGHFAFADTAVVQFPLPGNRPLSGNESYDPPRMMAGDVDGDGIPEIVAPVGWKIFDDPSSLYDLAVYHSVGRGGLDPTAFVHRQVNYGLMADLSGTGRSEMVSAYSDDEGDSGLEVDDWPAGSAVPAPSTTLRLPYFAGPLAVADLDGHGAPSVVTASSGGLQGVPRDMNALVITRTQPADSGTPTLASLVSASVAGGVVRIEWSLDAHSPSNVAVERSVAGAGWSVRATLAPDAAGRVAFSDAAAPAGTRIGYRLAWSEGGRRVTAAETDVTTPGALRFSLRALASTGHALAFAIDTPDAGEARFEVFDVAGRRVSDQRVRVAPGTPATAVPPGHLAPGLYLARATLGARRATARAVVLR